MAGNQYNKIGTLAPTVPQIIDIKSDGKFVASSVLIKNDDNANTLTCRADGVPGDAFPIAAGESLVMRGSISQVKLESTLGGNFRVLAAEDESEFLPLILSGGGGGGAAYVADETTLHLAGFTFGIKNLGVTSAQVADSTLTRTQVGSGVDLDNGMSDQLWLSLAAGNVIAGQTVRIQLGAISDQIYTWVAGAPAAPGEVQVGGTEAISLTNLAARIVINQGAYINSLFDGVTSLDLWTDDLTGAGFAITISGGNLGSHGALPGQNRAPSRVALMSVRRNALAGDATRGAMTFGFPGCTAILGYNVTVYDGLDAAKACNATMSAFANRITITNGAATVPFASSDTICINAVCVVS